MRRGLVCLILWIFLFSPSKGAAEEFPNFHSIDLPSEGLFFDWVKHKLLREIQTIRQQPIKVSKAPKATLFKLLDSRGAARYSDILELSQADKTNQLISKLSKFKDQSIFLNRSRTYSEPNNFWVDKQNPEYIQNLHLILFPLFEEAGGVVARSGSSPFGLLFLPFNRAHLRTFVFQNNKNFADPTFHEMCASLQQLYEPKLILSIFEILYSGVNAKNLESLSNEQQGLVFDVIGIYAAESLMDLRKYRKDPADVPVLHLGARMLKNILISSYFFQNGRYLARGIDGRTKLIPGRCMTFQRRYSTTILKNMVQKQISGYFEQTKAGNYKKLIEATPAKIDDLFEALAYLAENNEPELQKIALEMLSEMLHKGTAIETFLLANQSKVEPSILSHDDVVRLNNIL